MKKKTFFIAIIFLITFLIGGVNIMADKNIQIVQRNESNTEWDKHYPITKAENVLTERGTVASQLAEKANTTDVNAALASIETELNNMVSFVPKKSKYAIASKFVPELRNVSEFDAVENTTLSKGVATPTTSVNASLARAIDTGCKNYSVQALLYWNSVDVAEYIGFNTSALGQSFGSVPEFLAAGFNPDGLVLFRGGVGPEIIMSMTGYDAGWYIITMTSTNGGEGHLTISPVDTVYKTKSFELSVFPTINNFNSFFGSPGSSSAFKNVKVLADTNNIYNFLIPIIESEKNFHTGYTFTVNGVKTILHIPASYNQNAKSRCVIFDHGAGVLATDLWDTAFVAEVTNSLLDAGYVVLATDCTSLHSWGNQQSGADLANMVAFYKNIVNIQDEFYVIGQSMGGLVSLNGIYQGKIKAKAFIGIYPVTNLLNMFNFDATYKSAIKTAYGFTDSADFETATNGYDPLNDNDGKLFAKIPAKIWHSSTDTLVSKALNADAYATKINALGGSVTVVTTTGNHGDPSNYDADSIVDFFNSY